VARPRVRANDGARHHRARPREAGPPASFTASSCSKARPAGRCSSANGVSVAKVPSRTQGNLSPTARSPIARPSRLLDGKRLARCLINPARPSAPKPRAHPAPPATLPELRHGAIAVVDISTSNDQNLVAYVGSARSTPRSSATGAAHGRPETQSATGARHFMILSKGSQLHDGRRRRPQRLLEPARRARAISSIRASPCTHLLARRLAK